MPAENPDFNDFIRELWSLGKYKKKPATRAGESVLLLIAPEESGTVRTDLDPIKDFVMDQYDRTLFINLRSNPTLHALADIAPNRLIELLQQINVYSFPADDDDNLYLAFDDVIDLYAQHGSMKSLKMVQLLRHMKDHIDKQTENDS